MVVVARVEEVVTKEAVAAEEVAMAEVVEEVI